MTPGGDGVMRQTTNPLLAAWTAPHGLPPFAAIRPEHFAPAFEQAMREHRSEIDAMAADAAAPDFDNTVAAFDRSGRLLARLEGVFHNLCASESTPALLAVQRELAAPLAAHEQAVTTHAGYFARLQALHDRRDHLGLAPEPRRLLERLHLEFVRAGARLQGPARERHAAIVERLAELTTRFGQNVLADENGWVLALRGEDDLAGLPADLRAAARAAAAQRGLDGHAVTLARSSAVPFLSFSTRRDLRERVWRAWTSRGEHDGASDNRGLVREILALRAEQAALHGYASYADYALADTMAGGQGAVWTLLDDVWARACTAVERERAELQAMQRELGAAGEAIEAWDWRWWAEQVRRRHYAVDDAEVKPYFEVHAMVRAAFDCAHRLFGLSFHRLSGLALYHPDVQAWEVRGADGRVAGLFLHDLFARPSKRSGAWMSALRWQQRNAGALRPIVVNNCNIVQAGAGEPTLLGFDDVRTLFHEFGHGLHGLLSDVTYERLSGTQVRRDFVELPSQLFEHWMEEPAVLREHARHVRTGEPIPEALIERLQRARRFGQGYEAVRYTASAITDLAAHACAAADVPADPVAFEAGVLAARGLPAGVGLNHRFTHFQHLYAGSGYAAGYYVYLWAEVLEADAFDAFVEAGDPFDAAVAERLRRCVYAAGDSVDPAAAFEALRGRAPRLGPMLRQRGLLEPAS